MITKDPSGLSYTEIARRLDIDPSSIFVMRNQQPKRFQYILSLDPYFEKGFKKYEDLQTEVRFKLEEMYYELEEKQYLSKFSKYLYSIGLYSHPNSWIANVSFKIFKYNNRHLKHVDYLQKLKIIEAYQDFKKLD